MKLGHGLLSLLLLSYALAGYSAPEDADEAGMLGVVTETATIPPKLKVSIEPSHALYVLSRGSITLGEASFILQADEGQDCWKYQYVAKPSGLAKLFIGTVTEQSHFCIVEGMVRSQTFSFDRKDKREDNFDLSFNWADKMVRSSIGEMRPLEDGMIDRLAMQYAVQRWVIGQNGMPGPDEITLTKVEDDRIKPYTFRIVSREKIETPAGSFDAVRVERVDDPKKSTRFWLAPSRGYMPIKVEQVKKGSEQFKMLLKN